MTPKKIGHFPDSVANPIVNHPQNHHKWVGDIKYSQMESLLFSHIRPIIWFHSIHSVHFCWLTLVIYPLLAIIHHYQPPLTIELTTTRR